MEDNLENSQLENSDKSSNEYDKLKLQKEEIIRREKMEGIIEGRIVHYVAYNGRCLAGIIIGVNDKPSHYKFVDLVVFTNMSNVNEVKNFGIQFHQDIIFDDLDKKPGTCHWPERT
jgi:hypothetical protein